VEGDEFMSDWSARNAYPGGNYERTCDFCGCKYRVDYSLQDGHNEKEEYYCPDCGKEYGVRACITPNVTKISGRTDNRDVKYTEGE